MSKRSFTARQALAALLAAVCLPFLSVAKPPDLPTTSKVECKEDSTGKTLFGVGVNSDAGLTRSIVRRERNVVLQSALRLLLNTDPSNNGYRITEVEIVEGGGSIVFVPKMEFVSDPVEDYLYTVQSRVVDMVESGWRTLMRWLPVTCSPDCCEVPTSRLAVIEVLSFAPQEVELIEVLPADEASILSGLIRVLGAPRIIINEEEEEKFLRSNPPVRVGEIKIVGCLLPSACGMIERLEVMPTLVDCPSQRLIELLNTSEAFGPPEITEEFLRFMEQGQRGTIHRVHGNVGPASEPCPGNSILAMLDKLIGVSQVIAHDLQVWHGNRRIHELLNTSEDLRQIEYEWERIWFTDQPSHLTPQRVHGGVGPVSGSYPVAMLDELVGLAQLIALDMRLERLGYRLAVPHTEYIEFMPRLDERTPRAAIREVPFAEFMCLVEDCRELLPAPIRCGGSCPDQVAPPRVGEISKFTLFPRECFLDNMSRLERAQQLCRDAEHCCKTGNTCPVVRCFAEAAQLCPGSACAAACAARLRELIAGQAQTIIQTSAKEVEKDEKKSSGTRIEIKLTIEIKR